MSEDKIVSINRGRYAPAEVDVELIERLETIQAQAKDGRLKPKDQSSRLSAATMDCLNPAGASSTHL